MNFPYEVAYEFATRSFYTFLRRVSTGRFSIYYDYYNRRIDTEREGTRSLDGEEQRRRITAMYGKKVSGKEVET